MVSVSLLTGNGTEPERNIKMDLPENLNVPDSNEEQELPLGFESNDRKMWLYGRCQVLIECGIVIIIYGSYYIFNGWFYEKDTGLNSNYIITELLKAGLTYPLPGDVRFVKNILMTKTHRKKVCKNAVNYGKI
ncbi:MAG TPA: hypothetical protein DCS12_06910 [Clostridiales bacterium]|nr:hypothetical protein [Clostridiales bacterium]